MLLGFYVQAAFTRYMSAGRVWTHDLRFACSSLAAQFMSLFPEGALHEGDHQRAVAHVAALPLVLKHELLHSRDTRELKGLLSSEDLLHIQCAESMANHCLDVIRAYYAAGSSHKDMFTKKVVMNNRASPMNLSITHIENGIALSKFLRSYEIAPGFQILLNLLLATWFLVLPFAIAERSGMLSTVITFYLFVYRFPCISDDIFPLMINQAGLQYCGYRSSRMGYWGKLHMLNPSSRGFKSRMKNQLLT